MNSPIRNTVRAAPTIVDPKTNTARSFCLMILMSPITKAEMPAPNPTSIEIAKAGLLIISANIVPPAGTDLYNEFVRDEPMMNNTNIARMSPTDHLPKFVFGISPPNIVFIFIIQLCHQEPNS